MTISRAEFETRFHALLGNAPYPWQWRLFDRLQNGGSFDALAVPTGLGKTSVIAIWLLAHLSADDASRPPMRLIYVVNRRTIVDQATDVAMTLRRTLTPTDEEGLVLADQVHALWPARWKEEPLSVSALRGALADNRQWLRYPHRPAIIVGTVDMIGSRLLFDAYRCGRWMRSMHAGLLGQDALIVHDEAHLSQPFQQLLGWIQDRQSRDHSPRHLHVLAMSATGEAGSDVLRLDAEDHAIGAVRVRVGAKKQLRLHRPDGKRSLPDTLAELAFTNERAGGPPQRVIVFVRTPKVAKDVCERLSKFKVDADRIALLTGTIRGYERDELVTKPVLRHLLKGWDESEPRHSEYLVSTSAGEVGADFDADHLVCDLTTLDAMIQRLGRVNRRGAGDARVDVVADVKPGDTKTPNADRMLLTASWLERLPADAGDADACDASPQALAALREADNKTYEAAIEPTPTWVEPHAVTLDAWAMTSIQGDWPIAQPLDAYLHGMERSELPRTSLAWRDEVQLFFPPIDATSRERELPFDTDDREEQFASWLDACPLRPREIASERSDAAMELLAAIVERLADAKPPQDGYFIQVHHGKPAAVKLSDWHARYKAADPKRFARDLADDTFILPTEWGGLNFNGLVDASAEAKVPDVGDKPHDDAIDRPAPPDRLRVWLAADEDNALAPQLVGNGVLTIDRVATRGEPSNATAWRDAIVRATTAPAKMRAFRQFAIRDTDRRRGVLLLLKPPIEADRVDERVLLEGHNKAVGSFAAGYAKQLLADDESARAGVAYAGASHDLGKDCSLWQRSILNDGGEPLAKSFGKGMNPATLGGYRHEFGSLFDAIKHNGFDSLSDDESRDIALHLIAAHHGRGRPHFGEDAAGPPGEIEFADSPLLTPAAIACRYARLQRRFGHWGLAWIESIVMCADHNASRGEEPEDE